MKTKLTLTIKKSVIQRAKLLAKERNVSVSRLFEEVFGEKTQQLPTSNQRAAAKLLDTFTQYPEVPALAESDKDLRKKRAQKYD